MSQAGEQPLRIALVGPTAVGKTAVGIVLAEKIEAEIISADSMQVYRRMDIGTAKPTRAEQGRAVFHAVDVVDPDEEWTLADFQRLGERACAEIGARGRVPLIVGGTGLYVRALTTGLDIPAAPPDEAFRARWRGLAAERGGAYLRDELARVDPEAAARIHVNDVKRLIRALEVHQAMGVSLSALHARSRAASRPDNALLVGLNYADRAALYERIDARVDAMLAEGFLDEVRRLRAAGYGRDLRPMQSLGYRHLAACLAGELDFETAVDQIKQETRRFAKRQLIWFRADRRIHWLTVDGKTPASLAGEIETLLNSQAKHTTKGTSHGYEQTAA